MATGGCLCLLGYYRSKPSREPVKLTVKQLRASGSSMTGKEVILDLPYPPAPSLNDPYVSEVKGGFPPDHYPVLVKLKFGELSYKFPTNKISVTGTVRRVENGVPVVDNCRVLP